jgi:adenylyltransferase/sulfurtransferase
VLSDAELERYSRQLLLPGLTIAGQEQLAAARVLILGLGGLGSPAALYLAAAGVGSLVLVDGDQVEVSNLPRQLAHGEGDLGRNKARSAADAIAVHSSATRVEVVAEQAGEGLLHRLAARVDLAVDGSDNYPARFALNRACIAAGVPLVSAAAVRTEGLIATFHPARGSACYRCLVPTEGAEGALRCSESGVLGPVVGVLGSLLALEALKVLSGYPGDLRGHVLRVDLADYRCERLALARRRDCPDCAGA